MTDHEFPNGNVVTAPLALARFRTLAESFGATIEHWPEAERAAAQALLDRSQDACDALADAALLDRILYTAEPPPPSARLVNELERQFEAHQAPPRWIGRRWQLPSFFPIGRPGLAFAGMAAALLIAVLVQFQPRPEPPSVSMIAASTPTTEFSDETFARDEESLGLETADLEIADLEIALIDRSLLDPAAESLIGEPTGLIGLTLASAPSIEDLPLD